MKVWVFDQFFWPRNEQRHLYPYPGKFWDSQVAQRNYREHLKYLQLADRLGFYAICLTEHHYAVHGIPSPNVMAGALAVTTEQAKIGLMGNCLPLHAHPVRVAEELAMLDVMSGGRIVSAFLRGGFLEWYAYNLDHRRVRAEFEEAWDLIVKCWTTEDPFTWHGEHFSYDEISIMPRPVQDPHPPLVMGAATAESIEWTARKGASLAASFIPVDSMEQNFKYYREYAAQQCGWNPGPEHGIVSRMVYVGPTMEKARDAAERYLEQFYSEIPLTQRYSYRIEEYRDATASKRSFDFKKGMAPGAQFLGSGAAKDAFTFDNLMKQGMVIVGDPDYVTEQIRFQTGKMGADHFMIYAPFGTLPMESATASLELFAKEVLPNLS